MLKFKVGDEVMVTSGRDKGKKGKIEKIFARESSVIVGGINIYKRHRKVTRTQKAGIYEIARPISVANIAIICPKCSRITRVSFQIEGKKKNRICIKCKGVI